MGLVFHKLNITEKTVGVVPNKSLRSTKSIKA